MRWAPLTLLRNCLLNFAGYKLENTSMSLMGIKSEDLYLGRDQVQFQFMFGSKTNRPKHLSNIVHIYKI